MNNIVILLKRQDESNGITYEQSGFVNFDEEFAGNAANQHFW